MNKLPPLGFKGQAYALWCPDHGRFWADGMYDRCGCGYQTYEEKMDCYVCFALKNGREVTLPPGSLAPVCEEHLSQPSMSRVFETGASRDTESGKLDYEAFLAPAVLRRYAEFMHKNRQMKDGSLRDGDNWQRGIPRDVYMKSLFRHFMDIWAYHRSGGDPAAAQDALCAVIFNTMGYLFEELKDA